MLEMTLQLEQEACERERRQMSQGEKNVEMEQVKRGVRIKTAAESS